MWSFVFGGVGVAGRAVCECEWEWEESVVLWLMARVRRRVRRDGMGVCSVRGGGLFVYAFV